MVVPRRIMHRYCISHFRHHVLDILSIYLQRLFSTLDINRYRAYVNDPARDYMSFPTVLNSRLLRKNWVSDLGIDRCDAYRLGVCWSSISRLRALLQFSADLADGPLQTRLRDKTGARRYQYRE